MGAPTPKPPAGLAPGTVERWAYELVATDVLRDKLTPASPPGQWLAERPDPVRLAAPGRPPELDVVPRTSRSLRKAQLDNPRRRAQLLHTFLHHELQAAELMAWAILAFPETPAAFRRGLLGICLDELRHLAMYRAHIERLGFAVGDFPVRDWIWQRTADCPTPTAFVALMGLGLEGANLDHTARFAAWFRDVGDEAGAELQEVVGAEEVPHVRFALKWFREWTGDAALFDAWRDALQPPLTPTMFRGKQLDVARRRAAGLDDAFLERLQGFAP